VIAATGVVAARPRPRRRAALGSSARAGAGAGLYVARRGWNRCATGTLASCQASAALADRLRSRTRGAPAAGTWMSAAPVSGRSWFGI
jgi:hypothetical protein